MKLERSRWLQCTRKSRRRPIGSTLQPIARASAACYNPCNDNDGDDVGRSQLSESRRSLRGGSRARAQSPPESPGTLFQGTVNSRRVRPL